MNDQNSQENLSDEVLAKIKGGQIKMTPKYFFVIKAVLFIASAMLAFLVIVFLISFTIFVLRGNGSFLLPAFGWSGVKILWLSFPWTLVLLTILFVAVLEILIKRFGFAYRRPLIYSIAGVIIIISSAGIFVALTSLHSSILRSAVERRLPFAGPFYRGYAESPLPNVFHGRISVMDDTGNLQIETFDGQKMQIEISTSTGCANFDKHGVKNNQPAMIIGEKSDLKIRACGVREFETGQEPFFHQMEDWLNNHNE